MRQALLLCICLLAVCGTRAQPVANFSMSPSSGCAPQGVQFTDLSTGTITNYSWTFGNGNIASNANPFTTYSTAGTYNVTLTVTGPGGSSSKTIPLIINDKPVVTFSATNRVGCPPLGVQFSSSVVPNASGPVTYAWDFGDGSSGTGASPTHIYSSASTAYSVTLVAENGAGCQSDPVVLSNYITVYAKPSPDFNASQWNICSTPASVTFTDNSNGFGTLSQNWDFANGYTGTGFSTSTTYNSSGNFPVKLIVTDGHGCKDSIVKSVSVVGTPAQISRQAAVCPGDVVTFYNSTAGNNGSVWDFGGGDTAVGNPVTHTFPPSGTYIVKLSTIVGLCQKVAYDTITISPKPAAGISMSFPCPLPSSITFTANSPLATQYDWTWASGGTATGQTVSKSYPRTRFKYGTDSVRLITTSAAGCKDTSYMDTVMIRDIIVRINPGDLCSPFIVKGCAPLTTQFSTSLFSHLPVPPKPCAFFPYPVAATSWQWDFGDGTTDNTATPSHTYFQTGDYTVRCIVGTATGCFDTGYRQVHVDTPVHPSFIAVSPLTVCPKGKVGFINTTVTPLANTIYTWSITGQFVDKPNTDSVQLTFAYPGIYDVTLTADHRGCVDTFKRSLYVTVNPPGARFRDSIFCPPSTTVHLINLMYQATAHVWDFGDGDTSTALNPTHAYNTPGNYQITLSTYNSTYGCRDTVQRIVHLDIPILNFSATDTSICKADTAHLKATFNGDSSTSGVYYRWRTAGYLSPYDTSNDLHYVYNARGYYDVTLYTRSGNGCIDSLRRPGWMAVAQPTANFSVSPLIGCQPLNATFIESSTNISGVNIANRIWTFGDGDTVRNAGASTPHVYLQRGKYDVAIYVTDAFGCKDTLVRKKYVEVRKPTAAFSASDFAVCAHQLVNFTTTSTGATGLQYSWDFGDGTGSTIKQPSHQYVVPGSYNVRLIVTDSTGCKDTLLRPAFIQVRAPHAGFVADKLVGVCGPPLLDSFTNTSTGAVSYLWNLGTGGPPATVTNASKTYTAAGVFNVSLVATDVFGCTDTARATVQVLGYNGGFSYSTKLGCAPLSVSFSTPVQNVPEVKWDFSDGTTAIGPTATHIYTSPGVYLPKVIFTDTLANCNSISFGIDSIRVDQLHAAFNWTLPCTGVPFTLRDSSYAYSAGANAWLWRFGSSDSATGSSVSYSAAAPGPLLVTLFARNPSGCLDSVTKEIQINPSPVIVASNDTAICPGDTVRLSAQGAGSYTWAMAPVGAQYLSCVACDATYFHPAGVVTTTIYVSGKDANGCIGRDSVNVVIRTKTSTSVGAGGEICEGESFRLHAEGADSYTWMPAATIDSPFIAAPLATPMITTTYIVAAKEGSCLTDSQRITVVVHPAPAFDAGPDEIINLGSIAILHPTQQGIHHIVWRADTTLSCLDCFRPAAHPYFTRTYFATAYTEYGCTTTDSVTVHVRCNGSLTFIPNTFTPNGDGFNDYFFPRGEGIDRMTSFRVFDRWGELVFEKINAGINDERSGWDGRYKGRELPPDTYFYMMQSRCVTGEPIIWKGDITLMR